MSTPPVEADDSMAPNCSKNISILCKRKASDDEGTQDIVKKSFKIDEENSNSTGHPSSPNEVRKSLDDKGTQDIVKKSFKIDEENSNSTGHPSSPNEVRKSLDDKGTQDIVKKSFKIDEENSNSTGHPSSPNEVRKFSDDEGTQDIVKKPFIMNEENSDSSGQPSSPNEVCKNTKVEMTESFSEHVVSDESNSDNVLCPTKAINGNLNSSPLTIDLTFGTESKFIPKKVTGFIDLSEGKENEGAQNIVEKSFLKDEENSNSTGHSIDLTNGAESKLIAKTVTGFIDLSEEKENIDETILFTIEELDDSATIKDDLDLVASEIKHEAGLDEIEDIKSDFYLIEEFDDSETLKDDPDLVAHKNFFGNSNIKHEAELDGIEVANPLNPNLFDELFAKELPNQNEIMEELKKMRPNYKTDLLKFHNEKKKTKEALDNVFLLLKQCPTESDCAADPEGLDISLMQHQKRALKWMMWREKQRPYGGILADDMGLGKTLSIIALILQEKNLLESGDLEADWNLTDGGTLVICPTSLLRQWENEVIDKTKCTALIPLIFHGDINPKDLKRLRSFDVVITTYRFVCSQRGHYLNETNWRRIVLDEAHIIRNVKTQTNEAICKLRAKHRWALTGTPIHNKEEDMFALLKFLRFKPFDDKSCWATWLKDHKRLSVVVRSSMLRRTKTELMKQNTIFRLPPRHEELFEIELSDEELIVHHTVLSFSRTLFEKYLKQREERYFAAADSHAFNLTYNKMNNVSKDYIEFLHKLQGDEQKISNYVILVLLLRLRQICCHPGLIEALLYDNENNAISTSDSTNEHKDMKPCCSKQKDIKTEIETNCEDDSLTIPEILDRTKPVFDLTVPSTKMQRLMEVLNERVLKNKNDKAVIVSQWSKFLNIIGGYLTSMGVNVLYFNGSMDVNERVAALENFHKKREAKVLLLSLTAGGVGLNLVAANHLFFMEPHWNPQMESQAQDRIYRMGQTKDTFVYRFICTNSIEERIRAIQAEKLTIAENVLTGAAALSSGRLTITDLMKLFGMVHTQIFKKKN